MLARSAVEEEGEDVVGLGTTVELTAGDDVGWLGWHA
jgi:hypothetical protein